MALYYSIPLFAGCLAMVIGGSVFLSRSLGRLGLRLEISEQFLGFMTALGSDAPEITSSAVAMLSGQTDVGVGVVFGSNLFNLAALLGLTAVIAGRVHVKRSAVLLDGGVGFLVLAVGAALVSGLVPPLLALASLLCLLVPYASLLMLHADSLSNLPLPASWTRFVVSAASESPNERDVKHSHGDSESQHRRREATEDAVDVDEQKMIRLGVLWWRIAASLAVIIAGSTGLVQATTSLTAGWLPRGLLGPLVLAFLTGIPNLYTATRLAINNRGSAVMTEAMNSNSLNILVGLAIPSLIFGNVRVHTQGGRLEFIALLAMTAGVIWIFSAFEELNRRWGIIVIAAYLVFVGWRVYLA